MICCSYFTFYFITHHFDIILSLVLMIGGNIPGETQVLSIALYDQVESLQFAEAHRMGLIHRDLKPDNIFLVDRAGKKNTVKIVDFGVAKVAPVTGGSTARRAQRHLPS